MLMTHFPTELEGADSRLYVGFGKKLIFFDPGHQFLPPAA